MNLYFKSGVLSQIDLREIIYRCRALDVCVLVKGEYNYFILSESRISLLNSDVWCLRREWIISVSCGEEGIESIVYSV